MSCNGCRILRKGCNENCILRQSLQGIETPQAQSKATVFVAKFFGRARLITFLSSVPESHRQDLFRSLLFEACGRTVNPVSGAVGLSSGNWHACQSAVETVLRGGVLRSSPEFDGGNDDGDLYGLGDLNARIKREGFDSSSPTDHDEMRGPEINLTGRMTARKSANRRKEEVRPGSSSDESETTTFESGFFVCRRRNEHMGDETKLLRLFF